VSNQRNPIAELLEDSSPPSSPGRALRPAGRWTVDACPYAAGPAPERSLEHLTLGASLPDTALVLDPERYVDVPLEQNGLLFTSGFVPT
jgi:hypothetical protein